MTVPVLSPEPNPPASRDPAPDPGRPADIASPSGERRANGQFAKGNVIALKHGRRATADTLARQVGATVTALAERQAEIEQDLGGRESLSRVHRSAITDLLRLELVSEFLFQKIATEGPMTAKGKTRATLSAFLNTADRLTRLRQLVGLERRARQIDPLAAIQQAVSRAQTPRPPASGGAGDTNASGDDQS